MMATPNHTTTSFAPASTPTRFAPRPTICPACNERESWARSSEGLCHACDDRTFRERSLIAALESLSNIPVPADLRARVMLAVGGAA